ncbi:MAG: DUF2863 family protein [Bordetella sp.]|uniref:DUF2863 family protein n=1 Tax=Bordetella sp. TaxID=28081 RepID=UPI003F7CA562
MARTRSRTSSRLTRDASRLVTLAQALNRSGSRVEDQYWESQIGEAITKLLRSGQDGPLDSALDHLSQQDGGAYEILIEQAETQSESMQVEKNGVRHDVLLLVAPVVAWTRYAIPAAPIAAAAQQTLLAQLHGHVLAQDARVELMPHLLSLDQMPRTFSETWHWLQKLASRALGSETIRPTLDGDVETAHMLADTRYLVAAVAVPQGRPLFRWQEQPEDPASSRDACLEQWVAQAQPTIAGLLPGCGIECLLPDAYYVSNREADRRVRPLSLRAAVNWLEGTVNLPAEQLRAVVAGCGETRVDEYRIGFTPAHSNDVYYGCVWPLYGREDEEALDDGQPGAVEDIAALLREFGVGEVRRIPGVLPPEFCEDCGAPFFPNPQGELVHAELPEDAASAPSHFH